MRTETAPAVEGDMTSASGSYRTPYGVARTDWTRDAGLFRLTVDVPAGSTAEVRVPLFDGRAEAPAGARLVRDGGTEAVYEVGSGHWNFRSITSPVVLPHRMWSSAVAWPR
jgi:alpha-L-rhamnosidase